MTDNFKNVTGNETIPVDLTVGDDAIITDDLSVGGDLTVTGSISADISGGVTLGAGEDLIGSSTSDITINTDKFTVAGATGNVVIGGTQTNTAGDLTLTDGDLILTANASKISFTGTGANGGVLTNLKNAAASGLSGTQLDVEIDIGGTPYYFTVYPTKA